MDTAQVTWPQKKVIGLRLRTWFLLLSASPILGWGGGNLFFSTSFGTGLVEREIKDKMGLPCRVESVTWSPWAGVTIENFEVFVPDGFEVNSRLLHVGLIVLDPSWTHLMKGEKRFEKLEITGVLGELSVEQLKGIVSRYHEKNPVEVVDAPQQQVSDEEGAEAPPKTTRKRMVKPPEPKSPVEVAPKRQEPPRVVAESVPVDDFKSVVILKDANFRFYSESRPELAVRLRDLGAEIPLWGEKRKGEFRLGRFEFGSHFEDLEKVFSLSWSGDALQLERSEMKLLGVNLEFAAKVRMVAGLPMDVEFDLPDQSMDLSPIYPDSKTPIEVAHLSSSNVFQGYLLNPGSFNGHSVTTFSDFIFHDPKDGGDTRFDRGSAVIRLSSSGLIADDMRAIGDEDSVLINGFVTTGGAAAATVRIVSSPARAESHEKRIKSTSPILSLGFRPLVTPDREYRDIRIEARAGGLAMDMGVDEQWVPLFPTVRAILGSSKLSRPRLP